MKTETRQTSSVLCATDLGATCDEAIRQAAAAAKARRAALVALHVLPDPLGHHPLMPTVRKVRYAGLPEAHARATEHLRAQLERALGRPAPEVALHIEHGVPHSVIIDQAERLPAGLTVVGASPWHVGKEAERVVRYAHGPVLVARPGSDSGPVLVATDLSDAALPAVAAGVAWARQRGRGLILLHVVDLRSLMMQPDFGVATAIPLTQELIKSFQDSGRERLEKALRRHRAKGEFVVATGDPASVILDRAIHVAASLVVVGTSGATGLKRMVLGSVAETVVRNTHSSILVVRLHRPSLMPGSR